MECLALVWFRGGMGKGFSSEPFFLLIQCRSPECLPAMYAFPKTMLKGMAAKPTNVSGRNNFFKDILRIMQTKLITRAVQVCLNHLLRASDQLSKHYQFSHEVYTFDYCELYEWKNLSNAFLS